MPVVGQVRITPNECTYGLLYVRPQNGTSSSPQVDPKGNSKSNHINECCTASPYNKGDVCLAFYLLVFSFHSNNKALVADIATSRDERVGTNTYYIIP